MQIYQIFTRLFGNQNMTRTPHGTMEENGVGKMNDITATVLNRIHDMGFTHVWFTGIVRHATTTDYTQYDIPRQHPAIVKGKAGSPYAITDYYDVDPDLAVQVPKRMNEFEALVKRTHKAEAIQYLNQYSNETAQQMLSRWKQLAIFLIVRYNDMAVKPVKNGQFTRTKTGLGSRVKRPGFPASYAKEIVRRTGDKYLVPSEK